MEICTQVGRIYNTGAGRKDGWKGLRERGWEKEGREWEIGGGREGREGEGERWQASSAAEASVNG